jgi:hypothetical protein
MLTLGETTVNYAIRAICVVQVGSAKARFGICANFVKIP